MAAAPSKGMFVKDREYTFCEYIWTDVDQIPRSKTKVIYKKVTSIKDLPLWNYDGSSTGQAPGSNSEVHIKPQAVFKDPFVEGGLLVVCDTYSDTDCTKPLPSNTRFTANAAFDKDLKAEPWFGIEQEYVLMDKKTGRPVGWSGGYPAPQGPYYCGAGTTAGRKVVMEHMKSCCYAGIQISGVNAEVMLGQWEYQVGPCTGIESGDHLTCSRYIMMRIAEKYGYKMELHPKPITGDWNGSGCHTNYSTKAMREDGGIKVIKAACEALGKKHEQHIKAYGLHNDMRLTGAHETANISTFKYGVADRGASIRIPTLAEKEGKGYMEDRRPASNMDPYVVTSMIFQTTHLELTETQS